MSEQATSRRGYGSGPEVWEQRLSDQWDLLTTIRERQGCTIADRLATLALEAVQKAIAEHKAARKAAKIKELT